MPRPRRAIGWCLRIEFVGASRSLQALVVLADAVLSGARPAEIQTMFEAIRTAATREQKTPATFAAGAIVNSRIAPGA